MYKMTNNPFSLSNKTILVTGASSGIGRDVAIECSKMGANVIISGRNESRLKETFDKLEGKNHMFFPADLSKYEEISELCKNCPEIDGISHNAGIAKIIPVKFINKQDLESIFSINTFAPILLTQNLIKNKKIKKGGSIVFTSSLSGVFCVHFGESMYASSKGAISGFAKGAALELSAMKIRVNCVNPSIIQTEIFKNEGEILDEETLNNKIKIFPLKRLGKTTDVAWAHIFLLSDASIWITGINIPIDGGYTLI